MAFAPAQPPINFSPELLRDLEALEQKRRLAEMRLRLWLAAPVLIALPVIAGMYIFAVIWCFIVIFGLGALIHLVIPTVHEVSNLFKKTVMPEALKTAGIEGEFFARNGLSGDAFQKSGLCRERYTHFERYDGIIGKYNGIRFGLYELAVQVREGRQGFAPGVPGVHMHTNLFYGWVLHVPVPKLSGNTFIIPIRRATSHESDDWLKAVGEYLRSGDAVHAVLTGDSAFDKHFFVYATHAQEAAKLLQPAFREFLLNFSTASPNAPAFSFCENRAYMHVGIRRSGLDLDGPVYPEGVKALNDKLNSFTAMVTAFHSSAASVKS